jgi:hypothetical protein
MIIFILQVSIESQRLQQFAHMFTRQLNSSTSAGEIMPEITKHLPMNYGDWLSAINSRRTARRERSLTVEPNTMKAWNGMLMATSFCSDHNVMAVQSSVANCESDIYKFMNKMSICLNQVLPWINKIKTAIKTQDGFYCE